MIKASELVEKLKARQTDLVQEFKNNPNNSKETIRLYHGTTSKNLESILANGLTSRKDNGNDNYEDRGASSNENLVYLTSHFQYRYAFDAIITNRDAYESDYGEIIAADYETKYDYYYEKTGDVPIIIEVEVPVSWLTYDEDIAYNRKYRQLFSENGEELLKNTDWKMSLEQYTCASLRNIPFEYIRNIQACAYFNPEIAFDGGSQYANAYSFWANGFTKDKEEMDAILEEFVAEMQDDHLGAFEEFVPKKNTVYAFEYDESCLFVKEKN